jgi:hypothetical protein
MSGTSLDTLRRRSDRAVETDRLANAIAAQKAFPRKSLNFGLRLFRGSASTGGAHWDHAWSPTRSRGRERLG